MKHNILKIEYMNYKQEIMNYYQNNKKNKENYNLNNKFKQDYYNYIHIDMKILLKK